MTLSELTATLRREGLDRCPKCGSDVIMVRVSPMFQAMNIFCAACRYYVADQTVAGLLAYWRRVCAKGGQDAPAKPGDRWGAYRLTAEGWWVLDNPEAK